MMADGDDKSSKLMDEVKLYWTIQIGILGALGLLVGNLKQDVGDAPKLLVCVTVLGLLLIGTMYNLVGNYYTFAERLTLHSAPEQESIVTIAVARIYFFVSGCVGSAILCLLGRLLARWGAVRFLDEPIFCFAGFCGGLGLNALLFHSTITHLQRLGSAEQQTAYRRYAGNMQLIGKYLKYLPGVKP